ncbi:MAG: DNA polymerase III subunit gamma/tau [Burkholderiaceae bacterium]|nr:DNA polymerase III subunit gamma/tau [Burkholderiaceae bacterium]
MGYLVLARKYRPRDFDTLVGQEHVVQALANALNQQRLHHAYLFTGTRGVGKTTISRILAKSLNCTGADGRGGITAKPCGACDACRDIDAGRFVDYVELDAASNRGVEEITQLLDQAVYKPVAGRFKVYMIDEVHMLSNHAFNAMLKTLEEPPDYLKFVLATTDPQKVPPTVLSRCLQFNLRPMAPQTVQAHLADVLAQEGIAAEPGALRLISRAAHGSMRDALSLADQAIAFGAGALVEGGVRQMLGAVDRGHALRLVEALARRDGAAVIGAVDGLRALGLSAGGTLEEMASLLQQMAVAQTVPQALDDQDPETPEVARLAALLAADETQLLYSIVLHGRAEIGLAPDEYSGLVMVLLRLLAFAPQETAPSAEVRRAAPAPARASAAAAAARPAARSAVMPPEPAPWDDEPQTEPARAVPLRAQEAPARGAPRVAESGAGAPSPALGDRWERQVRELIAAGGITALTRELALQAQCVAIDGQRWRLRVEREALAAAAQRERLRAALGDALGAAVALEIEIGAAEDTPAQRDAARRARRQEAAERIIQDDPLVRAVMQQYSTARIVPGSVKPH